ncbi:hypothetical protein Tco_0967118 [Tanacetum coccineum]
MRGMGGGGRVVTDERGVSAIVVTRTSTKEVNSMLRLNIETILVSGLGLSMYRIFNKRIKTKANQAKLSTRMERPRKTEHKNGKSTENRAQEWKEHGKPKLKAYTSLMGQPVPILMGQSKAFFNSEVCQLALN